jgi:hypothetical protein
MEQATTLSSFILLVDANSLLTLSIWSSFKGDVPFQKVGTQNMVEFSTL